MATIAIGRVAIAALLSALLGACVARPAMRLQPLPGACSSSDVARSLDWIAPDDPRDRRRLDRECARVQEPIVRDWSAGPASPARHLVVAIWNAHAGAGDLLAFVEELRRGRFTDGEAESQFVVLVQEAARDFRGPAARTDPFTSVDDAARAARLFLAYVPGMRNGNRSGDRGIAILSSVPLTDVTAIELPFERQRRVALTAVLAGRWPSGESWRLRVASVHLDLGLLLLRGGADFARARQSDALIDALTMASERAGEHTAVPVVIGGDFNAALEEAEPAVKRLEDVYPDARQPRRPTWRGPLGLRRALDRAFARLPGNAAAVTIVEPRFGSDHHPLLLVLGPEMLGVNRPSLSRDRGAP